MILQLYWNIYNKMVFKYLKKTFFILDPETLS